MYCNSKTDAAKSSLLDRSGIILTELHQVLRIDASQSSSKSDT